MAQAEDARLGARIAALEAQLSRLATALETAQVAGGAPSLPPVAQAGRAPASNDASAAMRATLSPPGGERFAIAALNLQAIMLTGRPYQRELQVLRDVAPPGGLPDVLSETLLSHAARGLATSTALREGFVAMAPSLQVRAPINEGWQQWIASLGNRALAYFGLVEPPPPNPLDATIANVSQLLGRGMLAAALADLETLAPPQQALLAGWRAQARARIAAEQALQETIFRALSRTAAG
jgi:hypothetical protein